MNLNWVADLPFGRGRAIGDGVPAWLNQVIGNWQFSGVFRWTSGFPFNIINSRCCWPTNWNYQGNAELAMPGQYPETVSPAVRNVVGQDANGKFGRPSPFADPAAVLDQIRFALPGEVGFRNMLRGDGYIGADIGVGKGFDLPFSHRLRFRWEVFNVTNTAAVQHRRRVDDARHDQHVRPLRQRARHLRRPRGTLHAGVGEVRVLGTVLRLEAVRDRAAFSRRSRVASQQRRRLDALGAQCRDQRREHGGDGDCGTQRRDSGDIVGLHAEQ